MGSFVVMRAATGRSQATAEGSQLRCTAADNALLHTIQSKNCFGLHFVF